MAPVGSLLVVGAQDFRNPPVVAAEQVMAGRFAGERVQGGNSAWWHDDRIVGEQRRVPAARASAMCEVHVPIVKFMA
jgi:hypothetical protein